jgi:hypothetical protein
MTLDLLFFMYFFTTCMISTYRPGVENHNFRQFFIRHIVNISREGWLHFRMISRENKSGLLSTFLLFPNINNKKIIITTFFP